MVYKELATNDYSFELNLKNKTSLMGEIYSFVSTDNMFYILFHEYNISKNSPIINKLNHILPISYPMKNILLIDVNIIDTLEPLVKVCNYICKQPNRLTAVL